MIFGFFGICSLWLVFVLMVMIGVRVCSLGISMWFGVIMVECLVLVVGIRLMLCGWVVMTCWCF